MSAWFVSQIPAEQRLRAAPFVPRQVNAGRWLVDYSQPELEARLRHTTPVLPICSFATPPSQVAEAGELVLPPLFREALDDALTQAMVDRIRECFPFHAQTGKRTAAFREVQVVELPASARERGTGSSTSSREPPGVLALSIDTAVEEHGPHLPLATDRIQCYATLCRAARGLSGVMLGPPLDYGHLVWGLAFGLSIDIPPPLLSRYVARFAEAAMAWSGARSLYVVDVHGSLAHRQAIQVGLEASGVERWKFRWLFEPLMPFAGERGDQHAGGVETVVIEAISAELVDRAWWPARRDELREGQMSYETAVELTADLLRFFAYARSHPWNGIVGKIENAETLDGPTLLQKMVEVARGDLRALLSG